MRQLAVLSMLMLVGCATAPPPSPHAERDVAQHPLPALDRPWLIPEPSDEITLFDTRALRELREIDALNANGNGRVKRPGLWTGVGIGAFIGMGLAVDAAADTTEEIAERTIDDLFDCLFSALFGGDCDD